MNKLQQYRKEAHPAGIPVSLLLASKLDELVNWKHKNE
jgi:hypothetical protein